MPFAVTHPPLPAWDLLAAWRLDPLLMLAVAAGGWLYATGLWSLWAAAGRGAVVGRGHAAAFTAGLLTVVLAVASPLDAVAGALFSAHMVQHLLLVLVAPPLIVLGRPAQVISWGLPPPSRRRMGRLRGRLGRVAKAVALPGLSLVLLALTLGVWHLPVLYDLAVGDPVVHVAEHLSLVAAGLLFWSLVIHWRRAPGWAGMLLFGATVQGSLLAALLTFTPRAWYASHVRTSPAWGLSPLQDQQLAGVIMWVPGGMVYLLAAALVFAAWLHQDRQTAERLDRQTAERLDRQTAERLDASRGSGGRDQPGVPHAP